MRRPSLSTPIAIVALIVALSGTALAASRYIITSTSQIKPSVLRELRVPAHAAAYKLATGGGPHAVIARARSTEAVAAVGPEPTPVPMTGATWTQHVEEDELFMGSVTFTAPEAAECQEGRAAGSLEIVVDGEPAGFGTLYSGPPGGGRTTRTSPIGWEVEGTHAQGLFEPPKATSHTLTARIEDNCVAEGHGEHFTVQSVAVDVLGVH